LPIIIIERVEYIYMSDFSTDIDKVTLVVDLVTGRPIGAEIVDAEGVGMSVPIDQENNEEFAPRSTVVRNSDGDIVEHYGDDQCLPLPENPAPICGVENGILYIDENADFIEALKYYAQVSDLSNDPQVPMQFRNLEVVLVDLDGNVIEMDVVEPTPIEEGGQNCFEVALEDQELAPVLDGVAVCFEGPDVSAIPLAVGSQRSELGHQCSRNVGVGSGTTLEKSPYVRFARAQAGDVDHSEPHFATHIFGTKYFLSPILLDEDADVEFLFTEEEACASPVKALFRDIAVGLGAIALSPGFGRQLIRLARKASLKSRLMGKTAQSQAGTRGVRVVSGSVKGRKHGYEVVTQVAQKGKGPANGRVLKVESTVGDTRVDRMAVAFDTARHGGAGAAMLTVGRRSSGNPTEALRVNDRAGFDDIEPTTNQGDSHEGGEHQEHEEEDSE
jgi:hypothetical protein